MAESTCSRPAVSTIRTSLKCLRAASSARLGDIDRILIRRARIKLGPDLGRDRLQLLDGGRPVDVAAHDHHRLALLLLQPARELGDTGRLARALQARHQDDGRRLRRQVELLVGLPHQLDQLVVDDLDHDLTGGQTPGHRLAERLFTHIVDELTHHGEGDVGLEEGHAHLAHRLLDVVLGQTALTAQIVQDIAETVLEILEHRLDLDPRRAVMPAKHFDRKMPVSSRPVAKLPSIMPGTGRGYDKAPFSTPSGLGYPCVRFLLAHRFPCYDPHPYRHRRHPLLLGRRRPDRFAPVSQERGLETAAAADAGPDVRRSDAAQLAALGQHLQSRRAESRVLQRVGLDLLDHHHIAAGVEPDQAGREPRLGPAPGRGPESRFWRPSSSTSASCVRRRIGP